MPSSTPPHAVPLVIAGAGRNRDAARASDGSAVRELVEDKSKRFELSVVALKPEETRSFGAVKVTAAFPVVHGESGGPFLAYRGRGPRAMSSPTAPTTEWTEDR